VLVFPHSDVCGYRGFAYRQINTTYMNGVLIRQTTVHEIGHLLGLSHSRSLWCGDGRTVAPLAECHSTEYGDTTDVMSNYDGHFNAYQKERLGWLGYGVSPSLDAVTASGIYPLEPYEPPGAGPKALKIVKDIQPPDPGVPADVADTTYYYLEYRSDPSRRQGVMLHMGTDTNPAAIYLLDGTPSPSSFQQPEIPVGQTFRDPVAGIRVTPVITDSGGAAVSVVFGPSACGRAYPVVSVTPQASAWVKAGSTVSFAMMLTNRATADCGASTFSIAEVLPAGWGGHLSRTSVSLNPGASAQITAKATSPGSEAPGFYPVRLTATNANEAAFGGGSSPTY
jgi:hypothetical protein